MTSHRPDAAHRTAVGRPHLDNPYDTTSGQGTGPARALRTLAGAAVVTGAAIAMSGTAAADDSSGFGNDSSGFSDVSTAPAPMETPSIGTPSIGTPFEAGPAGDLGTTAPSTPPAPEAAPSTPESIPTPTPEPIPTTVTPGTASPATAAEPVLTAPTPAEPSADAPPTQLWATGSPAAVSPAPTGPITTPEAAPAIDPAPAPATTTDPAGLGTTENVAAAEQFGTTDQATTAAVDEFVNGSRDDTGTTSSPAVSPTGTPPIEAIAPAAPGITVDGALTSPAEQVPDPVIGAPAPAPTENLLPTPHPTPDPTTTTDDTTDGGPTAAALDGPVTGRPPATDGTAVTDPTSGTQPWTDGASSGASTELTNPPTVPVTPDATPPGSAAPGPTAPGPATAPGPDAQQVAVAGAPDTGSPGPDVLGTGPPDTGPSSTDVMGTSPPDTGSTSTGDQWWNEVTPQTAVTAAGASATGADGPTPQPGYDHVGPIDPLGQGPTSTTGDAVTTGSIDHVPTTVDGLPLTTGSPVLTGQDGPPSTTDRPQWFEEPAAAPTTGSPIDPDSGTPPSTPAHPGSDGAPLASTPQEPVPWPGTIADNGTPQEIPDVSPGPDRNTPTDAATTGAAYPAPTPGPPPYADGPARPGAGTATPDLAPPDTPVTVRSSGGDGPWPVFHAPTEPALVVRPSTPIDNLPRDPVRGPLVDHLAGAGAADLRALWDAQYPINSDEDWYDAVARTAGLLRQIPLNTPAMSPQRADELFATGSPAPGMSLVAPPSSPPAAVGGLYGIPPEEARRMLVDGGPSGLTTPEVACWLVHDCDGVARVLPVLEIGTETSINNAGSPLTSLRLQGIEKAALLHTHPYPGYNTTGLSTGDNQAGMGLQEYLAFLGAPVPLWVSSVDLMTGTVTNGEVDPTGGWGQLHVYQGAGPINDEVVVEPYRIDAASSFFAKPLGVDIVPHGTSQAMDRVVRAQLQPTSEELQQRLDEARELALFDTRLTGVADPRQRTPEEFLKQLLDATAEANRRREADGQDNPRPDPDISTDQDDTEQTPGGTAQSPAPSRTRGRGVAFAPDKPRWDPDLSPNRQNEGPRPPTQPVRDRPTPPDWYDPGRLGGFGTGPQPDEQTHTGSPRPDTRDLENHTTRFPLGPEDLDDLDTTTTREPTQNPQTTPRTTPSTSRREITAPIPSNTTGRVSPALSTSTDPVTTNPAPPVRTGPPTRRPGSRFPMCGSGITIGCIDPTTLHDTDHDGVFDNRGTLILGSIVGPGLVGEGLVGEGRVGEGRVGPGPAPTARPTARPQQTGTPAPSAAQRPVTPRSATQPQTTQPRAITQQPRPVVQQRTAPQPRTVAPQPVRRPDPLAQAAAAVQGVVDWGEENVVAPVVGALDRAGAAYNRAEAAGRALLQESQRTTITSVQALDGVMYLGVQRYLVEFANGGRAVYDPQGRRIEVEQGDPPSSVSAWQLPFKAMEGGGGLLPTPAGSGGLLPRMRTVPVP